MPVSPAYFSLLLMVVAIGLVLIGVFFIARGFVGRAMLSEPHCGRCGYDLRGHLLGQAQSQVCPECGNDLAKPGGVHFGRAARRRGMIFTGVGLLVLPALLFLGLSVQTSRRMVAGGPMGNAAKTNAQLITDLKKTADQPWTWQELESRYKSSRLSDDEVAGAVDELIAYINAHRPLNGYMAPLTWSRSFLKSAQSSIATTQRTRLYQAYDGKSPTIVMRSKVRAGKPLAFEVRWGTPWGMDGSRFVYAVREVTLPDGTKAQLKPEYDYQDRAIDPDMFSGEANQQLRARILGLKEGTYNLTFVCDAGVVAEDAPMTGLNNKPGQKNRWVKPLDTWQATVKMPITVVPSDQQVIELVQDESLSPKSVLLPPRVIVKRSQGGGVELDTTWKPTGQPPVPLVMKLVVRLPDGTEQAGGSLVLDARFLSYGMSQYVKTLPASVRKVDLLLTPDTEAAEKRPGIDKIWGKTIKFEGVPLERYDLPDAATAPAVAR